VTALPGRVPAVGSWDSTEVRRSPAPVTTLAGTEGGRARLLRRDLVDTIACEVALLFKPDRCGRPQIVCTFGMDDSSGVAEWTPGTSTTELLARADDALLTAKAIGGDVVIDSHYETSRHE
jgi:GGDEF domain-containing protein